MLASAQHNIASGLSFDGTFGHGSDDTTNEPIKAIFRTCEGEPAGLVRGSLAVKAERGCRSSERESEYLNTTART